MKTAVKSLFALLSLSLGLIGCAGPDPNVQGVGSVTLGSSPYFTGDLGTLTYRAVDLMLASAPGVATTTPLIVTSVSDVMTVDRTSPLGNIVADMVRTRLVQNGHVASEVRLRRDMNFNHAEGEFMLSRNRRVLLEAPTAAAIVTGTYAASVEKVYVSLKIVSATDARIIAGADFVVPVRDVEGLLQHNT